MIERIIAVAAALGMIFGSTLTAAGSGGEPVRTAVREQIYGPIRPKEVKHDTTGNERDVEQLESGLQGSDDGAGVGGVLSAIGSISDPCGDGEQEQPTVGAEPEPAADSGGAGEDGEVAEEREYLGEWTISFYCDCEICCGQWAGGATASGVMPSAWWTAATGDLPFGTILYVDGLGTFEVQDRGTGYGWLDVFVGDHGEALANGLQTRSVYIVR